ncbi:HIRA-interacting protein 3 isoform X2 [Dicentrarchus labrax]|uniref:HIRA-interacting protein 3 isoform X2 n=1 Tax=Dicentrarchus labrax TaxID=13489 RepID=UPI0021F61473|nr:HIRA-interacting protein 3 isoform X2 [Dicentrarchus labrax]
MMASEKDTTSLRWFVCGQLRDEPDLSTLTLRILKKRYLAHVRCESLSRGQRHFMKQVVQEELMKMQDNDKIKSELETKKLQNKRKRVKENDEVISGAEDEVKSTAKKSRQSRSSSESEDKEDCKTGSGESKEEEQIQSESEDEEQAVQKSNGNGKRQINSEDSEDEEKSEKEENERDCDDSPKEMVKKRESNTKNGKTGSGDASEGKKTPQSDKENETDTDGKAERSDKINATDSSDNRQEKKVLGEKKNNDPDSDSSSLPSVEDEHHSETENTQDKKKKKTVKKEERSKSQKDDNRAILRLKRYIALCGVKKNYKKLLDGCRSVRSKVAVLKKELEDIGVQGNPSIEKCKKVKMKREEDEELVDMDVSNIIVTQGRPKRRASAWQEQQDAPSSPYLRTLNSDSDSDQEHDTPRGRRRTTDWANLQGIISDDADSD